MCECKCSEQKTVVVERTGTSFGSLVWGIIGVIILIAMFGGFR